MYWCDRNTHPTLFYVVSLEKRLKPSSHTMMMLKRKYQGLFLLYIFTNPILAYERKHEVPIRHVHYSQESGLARSDQPLSCSHDEEVSLVIALCDYFFNHFARVRTRTEPNDRVRREGEWSVSTLQYCTLVRLNFSRVFLRSRDFLSLVVCR